MLRYRVYSEIKKINSEIKINNLRRNTALTINIVMIKIIYWKQAKKRSQQFFLTQNQQKRWSDVARIIKKSIKAMKNQWMILIEQVLAEQSLD